MADRRLKLQRILEQILGVRHVYFDPPETLKMEYPAIRYSKSSIGSRYADGIKYSKNQRYEIIVIDRRPNDAVVEKILDLPYTSHDRHYKSDNLHHDSITIYY